MFVSLFLIVILWNNAPADSSARPFLEAVMVPEFVQNYLNLRDLSRPLSDANRVKVRMSILNNE